MKYAWSGLKRPASAGKRSLFENRSTLRVTPSLAHKASSVTAFAVDAGVCIGMDSAIALAIRAFAFILDPLASAHNLYETEIDPSFAVFESARGLLSQHDNTAAE